MAMLLGVIADDFTGASDIASMLARGGMRTELLIGLPPGASVAADAGVVALKSRSIPAADAVRQSLQALDWLLQQGCRQIVFKYCSTFDSTPAGNIGPVAQALAERLEARGVVACPALPENGRTVYLGHLFVKGRLLSESGLEHHPLTPMTDPDIRRWLARQSRGDVGLVDHATVSRGPGAIRAALETAPETLVIVDALNDRDLIAIGEAVADAPLLTGGSGVAMALPENFRRAGLLRATEALAVGVSGDGVVLSGSCSAMTRSQVATFAAEHPSISVDIDALMSGADVVSALAAFAEAHRAKAPLLYSSTDPEIVTVLQQRYGRDRLATALEALFGKLALRLLASSFHRLVVAGGETSGAVISALGVDRFAIGPEIAPGVPALLGEYAGAPLAVALKSGNFGGTDFFDRALGMLQGRDT
jgi:uncharacterized protein YgbK (DUF1537 family)